ncbi:MAG: rhombosortase [bacterium]|nr:rhombosortase [bacterium]
MRYIVTILQRLHAAAGRLPVVSLLLTLSALAVALIPTLAGRLQYERPALAAGELWRLVTCHFTHWSSDHLFLDVVTLLALGSGCERLGRGRFLVALLASALLIPLALWWLEPGLTTYRGLSGLDAALWILLAESLRRHSPRDRWLRLAGTLAPLMLLGKVLYETATAAPVFHSSPSPDVVVVPLAHLLGGAVGYLAATFASPPSRLRPVQTATIRE